VRIRSIRPEFWSSEDVAALDWEARLVFIGLWNYVDDNGVGRDSDRLIIAALFPLEDNLTEVSLRVHGALNALQRKGMLERYEADGRRLLYIPTFSKYQKPNRPSKPRFPRPGEALTSEDTETHDTLTEDAVSTHGGLSEHSPPDIGDRRLEIGGDDKPRGRGSRLPADWSPSPEDVAAAAEYGVTGAQLTHEADSFRDYWVAKPGKDGVKLDWAATWRNWIRRNRTKVTPGSNGYVPPSKRLPAAWT
jgi:hypothetical protein